MHGNAWTEGGKKERGAVAWQPSSPPVFKKSFNVYSDGAKIRIFFYFQSSFGYFNMKDLHNTQKVITFALFKNILMFNSLAYGKIFG